MKSKQSRKWRKQSAEQEVMVAEKAKAIAEHEQHIKAEVAREIFEDIEKIFDRKKYVPYPLDALAELKKKYTGKRHDRCTESERFYISR